MKKKWQRLFPSMSVNVKDFKSKVAKLRCYGMIFPTPKMVPKTVILLKSKKYGTNFLFVAVDLKIDNSGQTVTLATNTLFLGFRTKTHDSFLLVSKAKCANIWNILFSNATISARSSTDVRKSHAQRLDNGWETWPHPYSHFQHTPALLDSDDSFSQGARSRNWVIISDPALCLLHNVLGKTKISSGLSSTRPLVS